MLVCSSVWQMRMSQDVVSENATRGTHLHTHYNVGPRFWFADKVDRLILVCELWQVRMSKDVAGDGNYLSGLASFASRTCYANSSGDHLVSPTP